MRFIAAALTALLMSACYTATDPAQGSGFAHDENTAGNPLVIMKSNAEIMRMTSNSGWDLVDDAEIVFGTGDDASCQYEATNQAPDSMVCTVGTDSRQFIIMEEADKSTDLTLAQQTNPTLVIRSADATDASDYVSIAHDQTDARYTTARGGHVFTGQSGGFRILADGSINHDYLITFNEGASKGLAIIQLDGTAYDTTAAVTNQVLYQGHTLNYVTIAAATGTVTPAATASGVDFNAGSPGDNDHWEMYGGMLGASGEPYTIGTTPAFFMCAEWDIADVTGTDSFFCGFRTIAAAVTIASYADFASLGSNGVSVFSNDTTTGTTDTTDDIADDDTPKFCTFVSAAGVVTYTLDGAAPTSGTHTHTIGDGLLVIPFCQQLNTTDIADETNAISWQVGLQ